MLTNIYYYNFYKPYLVKETGTGSVKPRRLDDRNEGLAKHQNYILSKSVRNDIARYARDATSSVTTMKSASAGLVKDMEGFNADVSAEGLDTAKRWLASSLSSFVADYNQSAGFLLGQTQNQGLRDYGAEMAQVMAGSRGRLARLGIAVNDGAAGAANAETDDSGAVSEPTAGDVTGGSLSFDRSALNQLDQSAANMAIGEAIPLFNRLQDDSSEMLTQPLSDYMGFTGLQYHFNYKMGAAPTDGFRMIDSGMVFDRVL